MKMRHLIMAGLVALAAVAVVGPWAPASAKEPRVKGGTPSNFAYELRNGRRVPKGERVTGADGSWKEEIRDGNCVTTRQKTAAGEYRESRKCD